MTNPPRKYFRLFSRGSATALARVFGTFQSSANTSPTKIPTTTAIHSSAFAGKSCETQTATGVRLHLTQFSGKNQSIAGCPKLSQMEPEACGHLGFAAFARERA